jgi:hypothetical protein
MRRNHGPFSPSLQVFQEAANLFLDLLGKLLTQPDDTEQTLRRDSLMVIYSHLQISVFSVFLYPLFVLFCFFSGYWV